MAKGKGQTIAAERAKMEAIEAARPYRRTVVQVLGVREGMADAVLSCGHEAIVPAGAMGADCAKCEAGEPGADQVALQAVARGLPVRRVARLKPGRGLVRMQLECGHERWGVPWQRMLTCADCVPEK